jgi:hypothetical protein
MLQRQLAKFNNLSAVEQNGGGCYEKEMPYEKDSSCITGYSLQL